MFYLTKKNEPRMLCGDLGAVSLCHGFTVVKNLMMAPSIVDPLKNIIFVIYLVYYSK